MNGKWRIVERIGSGGMSTVYAATGLHGERVALKMLHTQLGRDADVRARFLREAYVAQVVSHPGIVKVFGDDVSEDGAVYLVLELLVGETLEALRVGADGALPVDEILDVADQVLDALDAAHAQEIIHRDVKPENVFVTTDGVVKVLDFGLARMRDGRQETTKTGVTIGTPEFMPPEQAGGRKDGVDERSDVWGVGALVFTSITGRYVHEAPTLHETLVAAATQRARPLRELAPHVPDAVAEVIDRALELEKQDRWSSAREMQSALRHARGHAAEMVPRPPPDSSVTNIFPNSAELLQQPVDDDDPTIHRNAPVAPGLGAMMAGGATLALPPAAPSSTQAVVSAPAHTERRETRATMRETAPLQGVHHDSGYVHNAHFAHAGPMTPRLGHGPAPSHAPSPSHAPAPSHSPSPPGSLAPPSLGSPPSVIPPSLAAAPPPPARTGRMLVIVAVLLLLVLVAVGAWVMRRQSVKHAARASDACGMHV